MYILYVLYIFVHAYSLSVLERKNARHVMAVSPLYGAFRGVRVYVGISAYLRLFVRMARARRLCV